jgi:predicted phosphatase
MSQKVIGVEEICQQFHERLLVIEHHLGKIQMIDQLVKDVKVLQNKCFPAQEEAKIP